MSPITVKGICELTGRTRRTVCRWQTYDDFPEPIARIETALAFDSTAVCMWLCEYGIWDVATADATGKNKRRPPRDRTHCIHNHDLAVVGTRLDCRGVEQCRECVRTYQNRYNARRRQRPTEVAA